MQTQRVCIIGGSGFIGRSLAQRLGMHGFQVTIPTRKLARQQPSMIVQPWVDLRESRLDDPEAIQQLIAGHDAVINMVGILHGSRQDFERAHTELSARIVAACRQAGIQRLLQVSALGSSAQSPSDYQQSKAAAEQFVMRSSLDWTVLRPSVVFGRGDRFLTLFAQLCRQLLLIPLAGANCQFQPIWVEDVAQAIEAALCNPASIGQTLELAGPTRYTLRQLVEYVGQLSGHPRRVIALPQPLALLQATLMECLPGAPLMSRDNLRALQSDNISHDRFPSALLGFEPTQLEAVAPGYLGKTLYLHGRRSR